MTFARCCDCDLQGPSASTTEVRDLGASEGGKYHHCLECGSTNVDIFSPEGLKNELAAREEAAS